MGGGCIRTWTAAIACGGGSWVYVRIVREQLFSDGLEVFARGLDHDVYVARLLDGGE